MPITIYSGDAEGAFTTDVTTNEIFCEAVNLAYETDVYPTLGNYHDYDDLTADLLAYATAYPEISQLVTLGQSAEGRELWAMKITDNPMIEESEPEARLVSTMHGDEPVGTELTLYLIDWLLRDYGADPHVTDLIDQTEIWIAPLMNPDGARLAPERMLTGMI